MRSVNLAILFVVSTMTFGCGPGFQTASSSLGNTTSSLSNFGAVQLATSPSTNLVQLGIGDNLGLSIVVTTNNIIQSCLWQKRDANGNYMTIPATTEQVNLSTNQITDTLNITKAQSTDSGTYRAEVIVESADQSSTQTFYSNPVQVVIGTSASPTPTATPAPVMSVPGIPVAVLATAGNGSATVSFTAPISNGGSTITKYTVTSAPGNISGTGSGSPISIVGLVNGTIYTFTVTATNAIGTGPASTSSNSVTPTSSNGTVLAAPTNFQMTHQGANDAVLTWSAAAGGAYPISHYKIYRNGAAYDTTTSTTYTDSSATNITTPGYGPQPFVPATVYKYDVSAVDTQGNESPQAANCTAWVYHDGTDFWTTTANNYSGGVTFATNDTTGQPQNGAASDIMVTVTSSANWWQPFSGYPFLHNMVPTYWAMELGMFNYMTIDLKPTRPNQTWLLNVISRVSPGDNYNTAQVTLPGNFGPAPVVGQWATYKIPFLSPGGVNTSSLQIGFGQYQGSISGNTLTITSLISGIDVQGSSYLSGGGIIQGTSSSTGTYLSSSLGTSGGAGTYTIAPSQNVGSTTITAQRTNMYKFSLMDGTYTPGNVYYIDNIGFTTK